MLQKGNQAKVDETMVQKLEDGIKRSLGIDDGMRGITLFTIPIFF